MSTSRRKNQPAAWSAVLSMSLAVAMLIAAEFMPVSLLTPMADSLAASEGMTGQAIAMSGFFAVLASLAVATLAGRIERKRVLLFLTSLMLLSLVLIASATNFVMLMLARALLGLCIGGFWALATAVIMRLVPAKKVAKALAVMYTGQAAAAAFAAPIGSYLGGIIGWRGVFWLLVPIVLLNMLWLFIALPSLPVKQRPSLHIFKQLLTRRYFLWGLAGVIFTFAGAFAMFTYLRPFLEQVTQVDVNRLSQLLLVLGCAGFIGTWLAGRLAEGYNRWLQSALPLLMALVAITLLLYGDQLWWVAALLAIWGALNTAISICWMAWLSQNVDDAPESAGSLLVAAIQAAILCGGAIGGWLLDHIGIYATFIGSAVLSLLAVAVVGSGQRLVKCVTH